MSSLTEHELVVDLDATLISSNSDMTTYQGLNLYTDPTSVGLRSRIYHINLVDATSVEGTGETIPMWGIYRPYLAEFLRFASVYFKAVHIWSAGRYKYVWTIADRIEAIAPEFKPQTVFTQDDCEMGTSTVHKPLRKLYETCGCGASAEHTLAIDDREDTFSQNVGNGILIPPYEPEETKEGILKEDVALLQFMMWLSLPEVMNSKDVRKLDKSRIFTTSVAEYTHMLKLSYNRAIPQSLEAELSETAPPSPRTHTSSTKHNFQLPSITKVPEVIV
ncbi:NLI interacting factor phosphatase [uncultured virus]|nr:NLI interacting factor phosphatase [uncultured virus]